MTFNIRIEGGVSLFFLYVFLTWLVYYFVITQQYEMFRANADLMLAHYLRRWPIIKPALAKRHVFVEYIV